MRKVLVSDSSSSISADVSSGSKVIANVSQSGSSTSTWGKIIGDINDQTDLVSFVDDKVEVVSDALSAEVVARQNAVSNEASQRAAADEVLNETKVNKVSGKGLSTNDYTDEEKQKVADAVTQESLRAYALKSYVDSHDATTLASAESYTDDSTASTKTWVEAKGYDTISSVNSKDAETLNSAKSYADTQDAATLSTANRYTDNKETIIHSWVNDKLEDYRTSADQDTIDNSLRSAINTKQDALTQQTAYTSKGSSTKVPVITTNNLGQVTNINEVNITKATLSDLGITATARELNYTDGVTSNIQTQLNNKEAADNTILKQANVVDNVTTITTTAPLSANQGKLLQDQINNLKNIGRFLAIWNCTTGLPTSEPSTLPYAYHTGDYYRVGAVSTTTNYKPNGSSYTGAASTTVETEEVCTSYVYYYDGTSWLLQAAGGGDKVEDVTVEGTSIVSGGIAQLTSANAPTISISKVTDITATATEINYMDGVTSNVQTQLDSKQATIDDLSTIRSNATAGKSASDTISGYGNIVTHNVSEFATAGQGAKADTALQPNTAITGATKTKITYDSKGLVTNGSDLIASDIPSLDASKITSGTFADARIASASTWNNKPDNLEDLGVTATASELNTLDGITATTAELNYTDGVTSNIQTQLNNKPDDLSDLGVTATASELNTLDGITATTTELNYTDGVTSNIQTQLNSKQSTITVNPSTTTSTLTGLGIDGTNYKIEGGVTSVTANNGLTGNATTGAITIGMQNPLYYDPIASAIPIAINADTLESHPASYFQAAASAVSYEEGNAITYTLTNCYIDNAPTALYSDDTISLTINVSSTKYKVPSSITVTGCTYTYTAQTSTATLQVSNPTGAITITVVAELKPELDKATNITFTSGSSTSTISWDAVTNATFYICYYGLAGETSHYMNYSVATSCTISNSSLTSGSYWCYVEAGASGYATSRSDTIIFTV